MEFLLSLLKCRPILLIVIFKISIIIFLIIRILRPNFKKGDRTNKKLQASLLNILLKIYEKFLHENLTNYVGSFFSKSVSAFRKSYKTKTLIVFFSNLTFRCTSRIYTRILLEVKRLHWKYLKH